MEFGAELTCSEGIELLKHQSHVLCPGHVEALGGQETGDALPKVVRQRGDVVH